MERWDLTDNVAGKIADLRQSVQNNQRLRHTAETRLVISKQRLSQIDKRLQELGINPDNVDAELQDLETQFSMLSDKLKNELQLEAENYNKIIEQTKSVVGG